MSRPKGSAQTLEQIRRNAVAAVQRGERPGVVARVCGVDPSTVSEWLREFNQLGDDGLAAIKRRRGPKSVTPMQLDEVFSVVDQPATQHGYHNDIWTSERLCEVCERLTGHRYHAGHMRKLARKHNLRAIKPRQAALEADTLAQEQWKRDVPETLLKNPR